MKPLERRNFLKSTAGVAAALVTAPSILSNESASEDVRIAVLGGDEEANRYLGREYRKGFELPQV